ncbi:hypothetical protein AB4383_13605, partial [Vibrio breoganii]
EYEGLTLCNPRFRLVGRNDDSGEVGGSVRVQLCEPVILDLIQNLSEYEGLTLCNPRFRLVGRNDDSGEVGGSVRVQLYEPSFWT